MAEKAYTFKGVRSFLAWATSVSFLCVSTMFTVNLEEGCIIYLCVQVCTGRPFIFKWTQDICELWQLHCPGYLNSIVGSVLHLRGVLY